MINKADVLKLNGVDALKVMTAKGVVPSEVVAFLKDSEVKAQIPAKLADIVAALRNKEDAQSVRRSLINKLASLMLILRNHDGVDVLSDLTKVSDLFVGHLESGFFAGVVRDKKIIEGASGAAALAFANLPMDFLFSERGEACIEGLRDVGKLGGRSHEEYAKYYLAELQGRARGASPTDEHYRESYKHELQAAVLGKGKTEADYKATYEQGLKASVLGEGRTEVDYKKAYENDLKTNALGGKNETELQKAYIQELRDNARGGKTEAEIGEDYIKDLRANALGGKTEADIKAAAAIPSDADLDITKLEAYVKLITPEFAQARGYTAANNVALDLRLLPFLMLQQDWAKGDAWTALATDTALVAAPKFPLSKAPLNFQKGVGLTTDAFSVNLMCKQLEAPHTNIAKCEFVCLPGNPNLSQYVSGASNSFKAIGTMTHDFDAANVEQNVCGKTVYISLDLNH